MNERKLSEKLEELADRIHEYSEGHVEELLEIESELRKLSNENYAPGNSLSWDAVKPKPKKQGGFISKSGKRTPF